MFVEFIQGRRNSDPSSKDDGKKKKKKGRSRSYDGDTDSQPYSAKSGKIGSFKIVHKGRHTHKFQFTFL
jgi:hypothetical protein